MAKTKAAGTSRLGRDSQPKYLGLKVADSQQVRPGMILVKQRGTKFLPGINVKRGGDDSLYALKKGSVKFSTKKNKRFDGSSRVAKMISIIV